MKMVVKKRNSFKKPGLDHKQRAAQDNGVSKQVLKEIVRLSLKVISGRYQGYVHVKTSKENMVLPVQVTVLSGGIHTIPESLDMRITIQILLK